MDGLARAEAPEGIAAMQWINRRAPTPAFLLVWLGTGALCLVLAVWTVLSGGDRRAVLAAAAAALYVGGSIAVTFARNVPMNDALERMDARDAATAALLAGLRAPLDGLEPRARGGLARRGGAPDDRAHRGLSELARARV